MRNQESVKEKLLTHFAPAKRLCGAELKRQIDYFNALDSIRKALDAIPTYVVILNQERQAVYANSAFCRFLGREPIDVLGMRFGEVLRCEHAATAPGGCGTSEHCRVCGALKSILYAQSMSVTDSGTCSISLGNYDALDLEIQSTPYKTEIGEFLIFSFKDVSNANRRKALERTFLHDLLNTAGGMRGMVEILQEEGNAPEFSEIALNLADDMIEEIEAQRALLAAENEELGAHFETIRTARFLDSIAEVFLRHEVARERKLQIQLLNPPEHFASDPTLARRVLINMVKNAFEATAAGGVVKLTARKASDKLIIEVHNDSVMSREVQLQIFKRSFSTKGEGRGLGTYSMRLFGEKYLGGHIGFASSPNEGTTFRFSLPLAASQI